MSKFNNLLTQIELFIKKYYRNQMIKGIVLFLSLFLFSFLTISGLEYFGRFGTSIRLILFYTFIAVNVVVLFQFIIVPIFKLNKISKRLSLNEASVMIGSIFPDISDKLENTLQLNTQLLTSTENVSLLEASIEQKASSLGLIPFTSGIKLVDNKKYLKLFLPILIVVMIIGIINPSIFSDGSERIVNYNSNYIEKAPFQFIVMSAAENVQGTNYVLEVKLKGKEIPRELRIESNLGTYNLNKKSNVSFIYEFSNVNETIEFTCHANGFNSRKFSVRVLKSASINKMALDFIFPKHTKLKNESVKNIGDVSVPEGTLIKWNLEGKNSVSLKAILTDTTFELFPDNTGNYKFNKQFFESTNYGFSLSSTDIKNGDTLYHSIAVIKDAYPIISVIDETDSLNSFIHFIEGTVSDDYGFYSLFCHIAITKNDVTEKSIERIRINSDLSKQFFYHQLDYSKFDLSPGDKLEYYYTITDNDVINNYKSTNSIKSYFSVPSLDSLDNLLFQKAENMEASLDKAKSVSKEIKDKVKDLKNELLNKKKPEWKDKQNLEKLLQQQESLEKQIDNLNNEFNKNKEEENEFLDSSDEIKQKQEELQKIMDDLMDDEMKALMEELQKLMKDMNSDKLIDKLENIEKKSETLEEELDRTLELFKNMEVDKKLESIENQLKELAKEQEKLKELTDLKKNDQKELVKKQDNINKKFDEIQKDIEETKSKNAELDAPRDLNFDKELEENIESETNEAKDNLENGKSKKSSKSQEKAAELMKEMEKDVSAMKTKEQAEKAEEDMDAMRFLLENIVSLSQQEEKLMVEFFNTSSNNPHYLNLNREQLKIKKATKIVKDSLIQLSNRVSQLTSFINEELSDLNYNLEKTLILSEERKTPKLLQHQQYAITSYNNLALMLSEVLDQMQNAAKNKMKGSGSCSKPGGKGSGSLKSKPMDMDTMKKAMKAQISKMKNGSNPGGKDGEKPGKGGEGGFKPGGSKGSGTGLPGLSSKEIAKMAYEQGKMRKSLEKMRQDMNKDGSGNGNMLNDIIKDIEKLQNDLLEQNVSGSMIKRQESIMTRLLESEKAMEERGFSNKRESNSSKNENKSNQIDLLEYTKKKNAEVEFLKSVPVGLRVYYKNLINEYFNSVNK